jgi:hypothetical protein
MQIKRTKCASNKEVLIYLVLLAWVLAWVIFRFSCSPPLTAQFAPALEPPFVPLQHCPRFIVQQRHAEAGLGHVFGGIVFAAKLAKDLNAGLVLHDDIWSSRPGIHGGYPYLRRGFGLHAFLSLSELNALDLTLTSQSAASRASVYSLLGNKNVCNIKVLIESSSRHFCDGKWCFQNWPRVYEEMRPIFSSIYKPDWAAGIASLHTHPAMSAFKTHEHKNVVWHLRASDITLHANDTRFFQNIYRTLVTCSQRSNVQFKHWVFHGEVGVVNNVGAKAPKGFEMLEQIIPSAQFVASSRPEIDLFYFSKADVLIGTGSSFPHTAALVAPSTLIYFEHPPKESNEIGSVPWSTYHLSNSFVITAEGKMLDDDLTRLTARLQ